MSIGTLYISHSSPSRSGFDGTAFPQQISCCARAATTSSSVSCSSFLMKWSNVEALKWGARFCAAKWSASTSVESTYR